MILKITLFIFNDLQLQKTTLGTTHVRWERFDFNKDAPFDEDENGVEG
jgi:hypothetical protein